MMKIAILLVTMLACRPPVGPPADRTTTMQESATVAVGATCRPMHSAMAEVRKGTGVIVSNHQVITALHVVDCMAMAPLIRIMTADGTTHRVSYQETIGDDLVLLSINHAGTIGDFPPPTIAPLGEEACIATLDGVRCGVLDGRVLNVPIVKGTSGSGAYDSHGRLVGLVVMMAHETNFAIIEPVTRL